MILLNRVCHGGRQQLQKIKNHQKLPHNQQERETLRNKGQFWTPSWVAEAMVSYVAVNNVDMILDPAAGRGAFFKALLTLGNKGISFLGFDIDTEVLSDEIYSQTGCSVEQRDFLKNPPDKKFEAIVANPPYIRHHRINRETKLFLKKMSSSITGSVIDGRAGYHVYFLILALSLLKQNGRLAFIMPADTCEGKFAKNLWRWISSEYCLDCVITFDKEATPFPGVDTNAIVLLIRNTKPQSKFLWIRASEAYSMDLLNLVSSDLSVRDFTSLKIVERSLKEGIETGLSRPEMLIPEHTCTLGDFADVMRGIVTGSNEFFFLTSQRAKELDIPGEFLQRAVGRTRDISKDILTLQDLEILDKAGRPTYLLTVSPQQDNMPKSISNYLKKGQEKGISSLPSVRNRNPWYKTEQRRIPPLLFAYLGRQNVRFIKNEAGALPLTAFLCVYPKCNSQEYTNSLWKALNHPDTLANLHLVGKSYGSGAIKVEPGNLGKLPIPKHVVEKFGLEKYKEAFDHTPVSRK